MSKTTTKTPRARRGSAAPSSNYRERIASGVPLFSTRLVKEYDVPFAERTQACSPEAVAPLLIEYFSDKDREEFVILFLDTAHTVTGLHLVSVGGLAASIVEPRQVLKAALLANAAALICAHNHPSGNPEPSAADRAITQQLKRAADFFEIPLLDHLIIAEGTYTSLATRGLL